MRRQHAPFIFFASSKNYVAVFLYIRSLTVLSEANARLLGKQGVVKALAALLDSTAPTDDVTKKLVTAVWNLSFVGAIEIAYFVFAICFKAIQPTTES